MSAQPPLVGDANDAPPLQVTRPLDALLRATPERFAVLACATPTNAVSEQARLVGEWSRGREVSPRWTPPPINRAALRTAMRDVERRRIEIDARGRVLVAVCAGSVRIGREPLARPASNGAALRAVDAKLDLGGKLPGLAGLDPGGHGRFPLGASSENTAFRAPRFGPVTGVTTFSPACHRFATNTRPARRPAPGVDSKVGS